MIGERIRHARDFCGLTQVALAELTGLTQGKISEVEAGRDAQPRRDEIERIAQATGFPSGFFFLGPLPDMPSGNFRRLKRGTAQVARQVRAQARQIVELIQRAEGEVAMPPVRMNPARSADDIEAIAAEFRTQAGVGERDPIPNLTRAIERAGVIVAGLPGEIPDHSGYSVWPDFGLDGRPVIVFARMLPGDRQRFTTAHEIGHLLLHSPNRDLEVDVKQAEAEANRFAGALLLPRTAAFEALKPSLTLTTLAHVKATFGISIGACAQRALDLGLINESRFGSIRKQLTSRGWHRQEPVQVENESPLLIRRVLDFVATGDSVADRAASVKMPTFAFRALAASN
jgi:Zn-dependent peptidase ImmA (M78 family)/transcriptional regulator with XRE-family HTH domain